MARRHRKAPKSPTTSTTQRKTHTHTLNLGTIAVVDGTKQPSISSLDPQHRELIAKMKVETPQILWHNGSDNEQNKNAPIYSLSVIESGLSSKSLNSYGHVLATAGNSEINLWKLNFNTSKQKKSGAILQQNSMTKIEHLTTLTRHDASVNVIQFSPDGLHLATAGDSGGIIVYSVPLAKRGNDNGRHFWSTVQDEKDLLVKIVSSSGCEGIYDLDWAPDSKRFIVGSLDHHLAVYELPSDNNWKCVYRNGRDHTHYIQGTCMDPKGVYVASMSCDRSVRVYQRKPTSKSLKKKLVTQPKDMTVEQHRDFIETTLTTSKFELGRGNLVKFRKTPAPVDKEDNGIKQKKQHLFAEESTSESFFRRLRFTTDGAYLVAPAGIWDNPSSKHQMATYLFARHKFDQPCRVLGGLDKVRL